MSPSFRLAACQGSKVVGKVKKRGQKGATGVKKKEDEKKDREKQEKEDGGENKCR